VSASDAVSAMNCDDFDEVVAELAVSAMHEPEASRYQAHAASCPRCAGRLDAIALLADHVLLLAPEAEPPAGFEARCLASMTNPDAARHATTPLSVGRARHRRWPLAVGLAAGAAALVVGVLLGRWSGSDSSVATPVRAGSISAGNTVIGMVELRAEPQPMVVISVANPRPGPGRRSCELLSAEGAWVSVGSWSYGEISTGVWAVGIDRNLLDATRMRVVDETDVTIADAELT
jgi:hypothetical protein